jgi:SAM-dependent methyltransferase
VRKKSAYAGLSAAAFHSGAHLEERQLEAAERACPLCLSEKPRSSVLRLQSGPDVELLSCETCGGYSASRMPTPKALRDFYRDYYEDTDQRITFDLPQRLANHIFRRAFPAAPPSRRIDLLDFGGGDAEITRRIANGLLEAGAPFVHILLVDYNAEVPLSNSARMSLERVETLERVDKGAFDLVMASAILEHIPRPRRDLVSLFDALGPGGVFYARTPSVVPLLKLCGRFGMRLEFTFPAHVHDLGPRFWSTILSHLSLQSTIDVLDARPSLVETTLRNHPFRTVAAQLLKAPWHLLGSSWGFVGGWEVFFQKRGSP